MRELPYAEDVVAAILRNDPELSGVTFETLMSERFESKLPYVFFETTDWSTFDDRFIAVATMEFTFHARGGKRAVMDLAEDVRVSLRTARRDRTRTGYGYINLFEYNAGPIQIPNDPPESDIFRAYSAYQIGVRPE